jgi:hypothetical protein
MADTERGAEYSKRKSRKGYITWEAIDPHDHEQDGRWDVLVSQQRINWIVSQGQGKAREFGFTTKEALLDPVHLWRGLRDLTFCGLENVHDDIDPDNMLCYVAQPNHAYDYRTGERRRPWPGQVFVVPVSEERIVYNGWWVRADGSQPDQPTMFDERFRDQVF